MFKNNDVVSTPYGIGVVWKVTEKTIHVKHETDDGRMYSKYFFVPTHHSQTNVTELEAITKC